MRRPWNPKRTWQRPARGALLFALLAWLTPAFADDAAIAREVLALDCRRVSATDVAQALAKAPTPRIILFQGSLAVTTMEPFADFLAAMGYPRERLRDPRDGRVSQGSFGDSRRWAGTVAWYYESEGMMPMLVVAVTHFTLMNVKARNEERYLLQTQPEDYSRYVQRTGRFFPRLS